MSRYLLDTRIVYWWMTANPCLGKATQDLIAESEIIISTASLWEMTLKNANGKLPLPQGSLTQDLQAQGFNLLPITPRHVEVLRLLAYAHPDPFDRLLIAQALDEKLILLTRDTAILALGLAYVEVG